MALTAHAPELLALGCAATAQQAYKASVALAPGLSLPTQVTVCAAQHTSKQHTAEAPAEAPADSFLMLHMCLSQLRVRSET